MRKGKLEHLLTTGKIEGKRSRGRQRIKIQDGIAAWLGRSTAEMFVDARDRKKWKVMIAYACNRHGNWWWWWIYCWKFCDGTAAGLLVYWHWMPAVGVEYRNMYYPETELSTRCCLLVTKKCGTGKGPIIDTNIPMSWLTILKYWHSINSES